MNKCRNVISCRHSGGIGSDDWGCSQKKKFFAFLKDACAAFFFFPHYLAWSWQVAYKYIYVEVEHTPN